MSRSRGCAHVMPGLGVARGEAGVALPMALIVLVVLAALAAAVLSVGTSETSIAANHLRTAQALSLAEAGLEAAFTAINSSLSGTSLISSATSSYATLTVTQPASGSTLASYGTYGVQYKLIGSNTIEVVATGTTAFGAARRVLRAIMTSNFNSVTAVLSKEDITISGSTTVNGTCGSVHSNDDLGLTGTGNLIAQNATASDDYSAAGTPTIGGVSGGSRPPRVIPDINPATYLAQAKTAAATDADLKVYELKSDGTITLTTSGGTSTPASVSGWTFTAEHGANAAQWEVTGATPPGTTSPEKAVFYVQGDAAVNADVGSSSSPWRATILVGTYDTPAKGGSFTVKANKSPYLDAAFNDLVVATAGNVDLTGNPTIANGVIGAGGAVDIGGTVAITGSIIAEGETRLHGNVTITYSCGMNSGITTALSIIAWGY